MIILASSLDILAFRKAYPQWLVSMKHIEIIKAGLIGGIFLCDYLMAIAPLHYHCGTPSYLSVVILGIVPFYHSIIRHPSSHDAYIYRLQTV